MRVIPVPDAVRNQTWVEGTAVFAAPNGDLTDDRIPPAEGIFYTSVMDGFPGHVFPMTGVILLLEDADVAAIESGARHLLMSWYGRRMPVFVVPRVMEIPHVP